MCVELDNYYRNFVTFVAGMKIVENIDLAPYNSFGVSVKAARYAEVTSAEDAAELFARPEVTEQGWMALGDGCNVLFTGDYPGTIVRIANREITVENEDSKGAVVRVGGGVEWDDLVEWCVSHELWGVENLSLIPGTVGACPVQNIGAYGAEAADTIREVEIWDTAEGCRRVLKAAECKFGYRESVFKHEWKGRALVLAVRFEFGKTANPRLDYGDVRARVEALGGATLRNIRTGVVEIRRAKLPDHKVVGNAGSFFKNPVVEDSVAERIKAEWPDAPTYPTPHEGMTKLAAGWLIDKCGWKGRSLGRAGVHDRQALVLVNRGGATAEEVITLAQTIRRDVAAKFGVEIDPEVNII